MSRFITYWPVWSILLLGSAITFFYADVSFKLALEDWQALFESHAKERATVIDSVLAGRHEMIRQTKDIAFATFQSKTIKIHLDSIGSSRSVSQYLDYCDAPGCRQQVLSASSGQKSVNQARQNGIVQLHQVAQSGCGAQQTEVCVIKVNLLGILQAALAQLSPSGIQVYLRHDNSENTYRLTGHNLVPAEAMQYRTTVFQGDEKWTLLFSADSHYPLAYPDRQRIVIQGMLLTGLIMLCGYLLMRQFRKLQATQVINKNQLRMLSEINRVAEIGYWEWDIATDKIKWSEQVYRIFGLSGCTKPLTYEFFLSRVHPEDRCKVAEKVGHALANHTVYEVGHRIVLDCGTIRHVRERGSVLLDDKGKASSMLGTVMDVSYFVESSLKLAADNKHLESIIVSRNQQLEIRNYQLREQIMNTKDVLERLRTERDRARQYLDIVDEIILVLNVRGNIELINKKGLQLLGYSSTEIIGKNWFELCFPENVQYQLFNKYKCCMENGVSFPECHENNILTKSGEIRCIQWRNSVLGNKDDEIVGTLSAGRDITETKKSQDQLSQLRQASSLFFDSDLIGVMKLSAQGDILAVNQYISRLTGFTMSELTDGSLSTIFADASISSWLQQADSEERSFLCQGLTSNNKETFYVDVLVKPVLTGSGEISQVLCLLIDITTKEQQNQLNFEREQMHRLALVREIHHRIKNHLQGVIGLLQNSLVEFPEIMRPVMEKCIAQINVLATTYGLQSQNENGEIYLCELIHSTVGYYRQERNCLDSNIRLSLPDNKPFRINKDEAVELSLVINELILNAIKHGAQEQIFMELKMDENRQARFTIINTNCQLPDGFNYEQCQGIGVGLDLVKTLLPENCRLRIYSNQQDVVTVLTLAVPEPNPHAT